MLATAVALTPLALRLPLWAFVAGVVALGLVNAAEFVLIFPLAAEGADEAGIGQGIALGAVNTLWALGALLSPVGAGALAEATGDAAAYLACAALGVIAALALRRAPAAAR